MGLLQKSMEGVGRAAPGHIGDNGAAPGDLGYNAGDLPFPCFILLYGNAEIIRPTLVGGQGQNLLGQIGLPPELLLHPRGKNAAEAGAACASFFPRIAEFPAFLPAAPDGHDASSHTAALRLQDTGAVSVQEMPDGPGVRRMGFRQMRAQSRVLHQRPVNQQLVEPVPSIEYRKAGRTQPIQLPVDGRIKVDSPVMDNQGLRHPFQTVAQLISNISSNQPAASGSRQIG
ncbi:hypothetical protein D3C75_860490 [compost metagenome]